MNRNAGLRAQYDVMANVGAFGDIIQKGKGFYSEGDVRGMLKTGHQLSTKVRDMFEGSTEMWTHIKTAAEEVGVEVISAGITGGVGYYSSSKLASAIAFGSGEVVGHWFKSLIGQKLGFQVGQWVLIDNGWRAAQWDKDLRDYIPLKIENIVDKTLGKAKWEDVTKDGFGLASDARKFGLSGMDRLKSYSYGFYVDEGGEKNSAQVFNFDHMSVKTLSKTQVAGVPKAKQSELESDKELMAIREQFFEEQGYGPNGYDDWVHEESVNLELGSEVVPNAYPEEVWTVVKRMGDEVLCVRDTVGASNNGERKVFHQEGLTNGAVVHRREFRNFQETEGISVAWNGGDEANYQVGGYFWVKVRPHIKDQFEKQMKSEKLDGQEIKDELALLTYIDGPQTHYTYVLDGGNEVFNDIRELKVNASPLEDEVRATLRKLPFFNDAKAKVMQGERKIQPLNMFDDHTFRTNIRLLFYIDFIDEQRSERPQRYAERRPRTKITEVTGWEEVHQDLGVLTKGKLDKGQPAGFTVPQDAADMWDWKEEMHGKGFAARPTRMDWEPMDPDTGAEDAGNGMAVGVALIAAALILAYS